MDFWKNFTYRRTTFESGGGFTEYSFFGNSLPHVESTMTEACKRLGATEFSVKPCKGGGFEGTTVVKHDTIEGI